MLIFDFFAGTGSSTRAFADAGDTVISFELNPAFEATENVDIMTLTAEYLLNTYGQPDFVWGSPPLDCWGGASRATHIRSRVQPRSGLEDA
jgi:site-specific DNA-cytosine methylase